MDELFGFLRSGHDFDALAGRLATESIASVIQGALALPVRLAVTDFVREHIELRADRAISEWATRSHPRFVSSMGLPQAFSGQQVAGLLASLDYLRGACGLREQTAFAWDHDQLARCAGEVAAHEGICWISERPTVLQRDDQRRPHSATGPAIAYPDGFELHYWHGVRMPAEWIEQRDRIDPLLAFTWHNAEQRRALVEIAGGWSPLLERVPMRVIQQDADASIGTLLECGLPAASGARFLRVRCGTGRTFVLPVPRECQTARQANAWTYGLNANEYEPEVRT